MRSIYIEVDDVYALRTYARKSSATAAYEATFWVTELVKVISRTNVILLGGRDGGPAVHMEILKQLIGGKAINIIIEEFEL